MTDDPFLRARLQQVAAYRELCQSVRRSGTHNVLFSLVMLYFAFGLAGLRQDWITIVYTALAVIELLCGLFKWVAPSAEGVLLDAIILFLFVAVNVGRQLLLMQAGWGIDPIGIFFGVWLLFAAINRFKNYNTLRQLFADRPSAELMDWVNGLIREIRHSDPHADQLALDLPTKPRMRAKLLGDTAFFVAMQGESLWVASEREFDLRREKEDRGTGFRRARLQINEQNYPEFKIDDASWENYKKWLAELDQKKQRPQPN
jgi:hypothetical protein